MTQLERIRERQAQLQADYPQYGALSWEEWLIEKVIELEDAVNLAARVTKLESELAKLIGEL